MALFFRYYNPRISTWYGVDPLAVYNPVMETEFYGYGQHNGGVYNWGNLNPYIYCYQNPVRYVDPNGKQVDVSVKDNTMILSQKLIFYGKANPDLSAKIATNTVRSFNNGNLLTKWIISLTRLN